MGILNPQNLNQAFIENCLEDETQESLQKDNELFSINTPQKEVKAISEA